MNACFITCYILCNGCFALIIGEGHAATGPIGSRCRRSGVHGGGALASTASAAPSFLGRYLVYHQVGIPPRYLVYHQGQARWSGPPTPLSQAQVALKQGLPSRLPTLVIDINNSHLCCWIIKRPPRPPADDPGVLPAGPILLPLQVRPKPG
jgi:hypothetical protein